MRCQLDAGASKCAHICEWRDLSQNLPCTHQYSAPLQSRPCCASELAPMLGAETGPTACCCPASEGSRVAWTATWAQQWSLPARRPPTLLEEPALIYPPRRPFISRASHSSSSRQGEQASAARWRLARCAAVRRVTRNFRRKNRGGTEDPRTCQPRAGTVVPLEPRNGISVASDGNIPIRLSIILCCRAEVTDRQNRNTFFSFCSNNTPSLVGAPSHIRRHTTTRPSGC